MPSVIRKVWIMDLGIHLSLICSPFSCALTTNAQTPQNEIGGFVKTHPNVKIQFNNIQQTGKNILTKFTARNTDGSIVFQGVDYVGVKGSGQMKKVVVFI
jgi:hypothetical protein